MSRPRTFPRRGASSCVVRRSLGPRAAVRKKIPRRGEARFASRSWSVCRPCGSRPPTVRSASDVRAGVRGVRRARYLRSMPWHLRKEAVRPAEAAAAAEASEAAPASEAAKASTASEASRATGVRVLLARLSRGAPRLAQDLGAAAVNRREVVVAASLIRDRALAELRDRDMTLPTRPLRLRAVQPRATRRLRLGEIVAADATRRAPDHADRHFRRRLAITSSTWRFRSG